MKIIALLQFVVKFSYEGNLNVIKSLLVCIFLKVVANLWIFAVIILKHSHLTKTTGQ